MYTVTVHEVHQLI